MSYLTINDIADTLGVHRSTISRILSRGEIPSVPVGDSPRVDPADFDAWLKARKAESLARAEKLNRAIEAKRPVGRPRKQSISKPAAVAAADA